MNGLIIGSLGIYLLMVGANGNYSTLKQYLQNDAPGFFPWATVIAVLAIMSENEQTAKIAKPFIGLAILTFILKNFDRLKAEYDTLKTMAANAATFQPNSPEQNFQDFGTSDNTDWTGQDVTNADQIIQQYTGGALLH